MKGIGSYFNEAAILFGGTPAQKRWIHSLQQEGTKIASRIQQEQNAETATLFARHIAPLVRSFTRGHFCASLLPDLLHKYSENKRLVDQYKAQISRSVIQRSVSASIALAIQISILFAATQHLGKNRGVDKKKNLFISPEEDVRPPIDKPENWKTYTSAQKAAYITQFLKKNHLLDFHKAETADEKIHIHNRFIRPLLADGTNRDCRDLIKNLHPDHSGDSLAGGFVKTFCPTTKNSFTKFFNNK